jgi:DNA repair exonuclease SbcCD ATPase subunit
LTIVRKQRDGDQTALDAAHAALPETWLAVAQRAKLADRSELKTELERLEADKTEKRAEELATAKTNLAGLHAALAELRTQEAEFPAEARHPAQVAEMAVQQARQDLKKFDESLDQLRRALGVLEARQKERADIESRLRDASREANHAKLLAELLDRDHLQLYLIQQAERQIVDFANSVLDRLSGGDLRLRLRGEPGTDEREKALDLEAINRVTGKDPIGVAFLSGSQRFRVAVSLALGIGQFASRSHRPIESVIIDEGFGCLDRLGRQAMIQELQNLRGQLKCVLLVSHQEEFADAFANVYRFELNDGTTVATRELR